jgi:LacI family transcriptional regulator
LNLPDLPNAIFGVNDQVAIGAMKAIREKGLNVPNDIAVIGFDNSPISAYIYPSLTSVTRPGRQIGVEASRLFLNQLNNSKADFKTESIVLPSELIIRESSLVFKDL